MPDWTVKTVAILTLLIAILPVSVYAVTSSEIETELMCDCGCGDVLVNCTCERSEEMRTIISGMINEGKTKVQILGIFVAQFGEVILSSPPRKGFNLVAYGLPMTGFIFGSVVAVAMARRWRSSRRDEEDEESDASDEVSEEMEDRIRRELENLED
jgi:cytochrome c-type biogenesis protein CcmH